MTVTAATLALCVEVGVVVVILTVMSLNLLLLLVAICLVHCWKCLQVVVVPKAPGPPGGWQAWAQAALQHLPGITNMPLSEQQVRLFWRDGFERPVGLQHYESRLGLCRGVACVCSDSYVPHLRLPVCGCLWVFVDVVAGVLPWPGGQASVHQLLQAAHVYGAPCGANL